MTLAWDCDLTGNDKLVLLALADWANDDGHCWPSIAKLCAKTRASERTVQGIIKKLVEGGQLTRMERPGHGCTYVVHPRNICTPAEVAPPQDLRGTPAEVAGNTSKNHHTPQTPHSAPRRPRQARKAFVPEPEPIELPVGMEGEEATKFRQAALTALGDGAYRNLIRPCHIVPSGADLLIQTNSETLVDRLRQRQSELGPIARALGFEALRIAVKPTAKRSVPDPKVTDAVRQLNAIRGGHVAGVAAQAGGRL
jgi:hypothetical protein